MECGHDVSTRADNCPHCGCPVKDSVSKNQPNNQDEIEVVGMQKDDTTEDIDYVRRYKLMNCSLYVWILSIVASTVMFVYFLEFTSNIVKACNMMEHGQEAPISFFTMADGLTILGNIAESLTIIGFILVGFILARGSYRKTIIATGVATIIISISSDIIGDSMGDKTELALAGLDVIMSCIFGFVCYLGSNHYIFRKASLCYALTTIVVVFIFSFMAYYSVSNAYLDNLLKVWKYGSIIISALLIFEVFIPCVMLYQTHLFIKTNHWKFK